MNENLNCSATNCVYNNSKKCYAGGINVAGSRADSTSQTTCSTFVEGSFGSFTNSTNDEYITPENIICQAEKCKYNVSKACKAEKVHIKSQDASCETFISK